MYDLKLLIIFDTINIMNVDKIRFKKKGFESLLSPLESEVLTVMWKKKNGSKVRDIHKIIKKKKKVALTSIAVILDRLYDKKIVSRNIEKGKGGIHYIYLAVPRQEIEQSVVEKTVDKLISNFGSVAVSYFNERFGKKRR